MKSVAAFLFISTILGYGQSYQFSEDYEAYLNRRDDYEAYLDRRDGYEAYLDRGEALGYYLANNEPSRFRRRTLGNIPHVPLTPGFDRAASQSMGAESKEKSNAEKFNEMLQDHHKLQMEPMGGPKSKKGRKSKL